MIFSRICSGTETPSVTHKVKEVKLHIFVQRWNFVANNERKQEYTKPLSQLKL